jgi:hypothetical protein
MDSYMARIRQLSFASDKCVKQIMAVLKFASESTNLYN